LPKHGLPVTDCYDEDWGWEIEFEHAGFPLRLGCGNMDEEAGAGEAAAFCCFITHSRATLRPLKREKAATQSGSLKSQWLRTEREERIWQALRPSDEATAQNLVQQAWQQGSLKTLTLEIIQGHALRKTLLPENTHLVQFLPRKQ